MIAIVQQPKPKRSHQALHDAFMKMLPAITRHARIAFRFMPAEPREEAVAEVVAMCWAAFVRLVSGTGCMSRHRQRWLDCGGPIP